MKLDNRPKSLFVKVVDTHNNETVEAVRGWFEAGGQVESLTVLDDDGIVINFRSRSAAEQALAKGTNIPPVGSVKLTWHGEPSATKATAVSGVTNAAVSSLDPPKKQLAGNDERPPSPHPEDMPDEAGWGDGDEDGMGMF